MKIDFLNEKIIIYFYEKKINLDNIDSLNRKVKDIFINLIKKRHLKLFGYFKIHIYQNNTYGCIFEIEKIYQNSFNIEIIDLKLVVHRNVSFYLEIDDSLFIDDIKTKRILKIYMIHIK